MFMRVNIKILEKIRNKASLASKVDNWLSVTSALSFQSKCMKSIPSWTAHFPSQISVYSSHLSEKRAKGHKKYYDFVYFW